MLNLSQELLKRGHEVHILTSRSHGSASEEVEGLKVRRFRVLLRLGDFASYWPGLLRYLLENRYDIIHTHVYRHPHSDMSLLVSKLTDRRVVLTSHSPFHPSLVRSTLSRLMVSFYDRFNGRILLPRMDAVIAVTESDRLQLLRLGVMQTRLHQIPNGVDDEHFRVGDSERFCDKFGINDGFVLFVGRLHPTKGIEFLLRSFQKVREENPRAKLVIAGPSEASYELKLVKLSGDLRLSSNVLFPGRLPREMLLSAYSGCSLLVLPSVYEPFGIAVLEAMAHGKPVIATRAGGPGEIIRDGSTGFLVDYGNELALAQKISILLSDEQLRIEVGQNARIEAKEYTWETIAERVLSVYRGVLTAETSSSS